MVNKTKRYQNTKAIFIKKPSIFDINKGIHSERSPLEIAFNIKNKHLKE